MSESPPSAGRRRRARAALRRWLAARLTEVLEPHVEAAEALRGAIDPLVEASSALRAEQARVQRWLRWRTGPFAAEMTVHQAWARHPGVRAIFARRHLPDCPSCAVGADETLAEVAFGYDFDLDALLMELNALLEGSSASSYRRSGSRL
ncbi:MAG: hypothetical protein H6741_22715 [Alphaproteobacteria bacterium]|nr:hypothetical protein [Alphaproteobacteria bacterium]